MAEVALAATGIVLSPFLQVFFESMASHEFDDLFWGRKVSNKLLRKLEIALQSVNAVLEDSEGRQFLETSVKKWLDEVKDTIYDAEDILGEIAYKDLRCKSDSEFKSTIACKVRHSISAPFFVNKIEGKIKDAVDRLEDLARQIGVLGLRAGVVVQPLERLPTTSLVDESGIFGRHGDKEAIINSLLSEDGASGNEMSVIVIVGMGGIGKTTLAQLVYNDNRLNEHFDLKVWICVSDPFDVFMVMKTFLRAVGSFANADSNLDELQNQLKEKLIRKKFLLVLDDVWEKNWAKWEVLSNALKSGAQGSKVIVTTRDSEVARVMHAGATHRIMELSKGDCWSLFAKHAFHDDNSDAYPELEKIGRQIVEKCKGLPLAIKAIGALLWSKLDVDEWNKVLKSELWDLSIEETGILPALGLSYKYLSINLKRCFAYCSIFPKDYVFKKDKLVLLWIAEGFLPQLRNKTMEEVGDDYFLSLVSRSLFIRSDDNGYIMHDLVSDLSKFISRQFTLNLEDDCSHENLSKTRHLSYNCKRRIHIKEFKAFHRAKRLHTIVDVNLFSNERFSAGVGGASLLLPIIRCLRVLILSHNIIKRLQDSIGKFIQLRYLDVSYTDIERLPDSIGKLKHLCYLDVSYTQIKKLPDSICKLCSLQILNLSHCTNLAAFPRDMHKLINLRQLDITETNSLGEMPRHLGRLKGLQTLTKFIVSKHGGSGIEILWKLTNLRWRGSFSILELQNFETPTDVKYLRDTKYLEELELEWKVDTNASESHISVLDCLQPHSNLKRLYIGGYFGGYGGKSFPNWVGHPSFSNIASIRLSNCKFCCSLPPLGQLPSLQELSIYGLDGVITVGPEFYGSGSSSIKPFGALQVLKFEKMLKWEEWFSFDAQNEGRAFPQLKQLDIHNCPKLKEFGITNWGSLPSLPERAITLYIRDCPQIESFPEGGLPSNLNEIYINNCDKLFASRMGWCLQKLTCVRRFTIYGGSEDVESFPDEGLLPASLTYLDIGCFPNLKYLDKKGLQHLTALEELEILYCPKLECMPEDGLPASLSTLQIYGCPLLKKEWERKEGEEWRKIAHVPNKCVNSRLIE